MSTTILRPPTAAQTAASPAQYLWGRAREAAHPLSFEATCEAQLSRLIEIGVQTIDEQSGKSSVQEASPGSQIEYDEKTDELLKEAEQNIERFVTHMRKIALKEGKMVIDEAILTFSLKSLCPLFPIC